MDDTVTWDILPTDILYCIFNNLTSRQDIGAAGCVCKSWQSKALCLLEGFPPNVPWLMLSENNNKCDIRSFFNLKNNKIHDLKLSETIGRRCFGIGYGWLLTIGTDLKINLVNPLTRRQIDLPPQSSFLRQSNIEPIMIRKYYISKVVASTDPWDSKANCYNKNCVIMVIYGLIGKLAFVKLGRKTWIDVQMPSRSYCDITFYKGNFYAVDWHEHLYICDINHGAPTVTPIAHVPKWEYDYYSTKYLVESSGALLMLCKTTRGEDDLDEDYDEVNDVKTGFTEHFEVLKLVKKKKTRKNKNGIRKTRNKYEYKFIEVENLDDKALFIGDTSSFSLTASSINGCKPNCIYYTDDINETRLHEERGLDMGVFNLQTSRCEPHYRGESLSSFCPSLWYI
ncbi:hypothetical protein ACFE04_001299 [Oxalis oulophora]